MTKEFWRAAAGAVVVLGVVVWLVWNASIKNHLVLTGKITRVRVEAIDPKASIVLVDFRVTNPTAVLFVSRDVSLTLDPAMGDDAKGMMVSRGDVDAMFKYMEQLKPKYNDVFGLGDKIPPGKTSDFMVEARFELPKSEVQNRKNLTLHLEDVDGAEADIREVEEKKTDR
jgi:hypothetical protein